MTLFLYDRADFAAMNEFFDSINWTEELASEDGISAMYNKFCSVYDQAIARFVPSIKISQSEEVSS
jgi:hypothetical protein